MQQLWQGLSVGKCLKTSQNHTFEAVRTTSGERFVVRVTPNPNNDQVARINAELDLVEYVVASGSVEVPQIVPSSSGNRLEQANKLIFVVFTYATGDPVDFIKFEWATDEKLVRAWGSWLARFHAVSREYGRKHPDKVANLRGWDDVHLGIMKGVDLHPDDEKNVGDPSRFGALHGDVNCSNFFYHADNAELCVFDWDQACRGWYMYDLAQCMFGTYMLARAGMPPNGGPLPVPRCNEVKFNEWIVAGYESVAGPVDRDELQRMLMLRRTMYDRFCRRAVAEKSKGPMGQFCQYVVDWLDKSNSPSSSSSASSSSSSSTATTTVSSTSTSDLASWVKQQFDRFDHNKKGYVLHSDVPKLAAALGEALSADELKELEDEVKAASTGDGILSLDEFMKLVGLSK